MDLTFLIYFLLGGVLFFGARLCRRGEWNEEYTSLSQSKNLQGLTALGVALHHLAQKSCAPWHARQYIVHGLDLFVNMGFLFVGVFFFCSGLGLYKSFKTKKDYLKGFIRRRVVPMIVAFYLSEFIYLGVRLLMGEVMTTEDILWYLTGLRMANFNAWYVIVIPFFYLAFYFAFKYCKREGTAIFLVAVFVMLYTLLGAALPHQSVWWMRGEWWYNSVMLFPLGMVFGKHEQRLTAFFKKGYWLWLIVFFVSIFASKYLATQATDRWWGYYNEGNPWMIPQRLGCAACQWLQCLCYVSFCYLLMLKVRFDNGVLRLLGAFTLEFYLMHGMFVEMFGYNFTDVAKSITYIRDVPLFVLVVLACSVPATAAFHYLWKGVLRLPPFRAKKEKTAEDAQVSA